MLRAAITGKPEGELECIHEHVDWCLTSRGAAHWHFDVFGSGMCDSSSNVSVSIAEEAEVCTSVVCTPRTPPQLSQRCVGHTPPKLEKQSVAVSLQDAQFSANTLAPLLSEAKETL